MPRNASSGLTYLSSEVEVEVGVTESAADAESVWATEAVLLGDPHAETASATAQQVPNTREIARWRRIISGA
jgi:hypothetical protein